MTEPDDTDVVTDHPNPPHPPVLASTLRSAR